MNDEMINLEQAHTRFEVWITAQLPRANLNRGSNGEHTDQLVNAMFVAFSAGMITAGVDIDWAKG